MDTNWMMEAVKQVPALSVLVVFVIYFLKHLRSGSQASAEKDTKFLEYMRTRDDQFLKQMENISEKADDRADKSTGVVERNTQVMSRVMMVLDRVESRLERLEDDEIKRRAVAQRAS